MPDLRIIDELTAGKDPEEVVQAGWQKMNLLTHPWVVSPAW